MLVNENQVRQLYVVKAQKTGTQVPSVAGDVKVKSGANMAWLQYFGTDLGKSDFILKGMTTSLKTKKAARFDRTTKKVKVAFATGVTPVVGEDYILRIQISQAFGTSDQDKYLKYGVVHATSTTVADFYTAMKNSLEKNFSRELTNWFTFTCDADGVYIEENEQPWRLGCIDEVPVYFDVYTGNAKTSASPTDASNAWGEVSEVASGVTIKNSKKTASLEYFLMGERGDQYRQVGWPYTIDTKYLVDSTNAYGYSYLELNYFWAGDAEDVNKSPKTITLVAPEDATGSGLTLLNAVADALASALGITAEKDS